MIVEEVITFLSQKKPTVSWTSDTYKIYTIGFIAEIELSANALNTNRYFFPINPLSQGIVYKKINSAFHVRQLQRNLDILLIASNKAILLPEWPSLFFGHNHRHFFLGIDIPEAIDEVESDLGNIGEAYFYF
jgi:hypothetical protein